MADITFEQIKNLVAQMPTDERDRLRDWLNQPDSTLPAISDELTWGQRLVMLVNSFDSEAVNQPDWENPEQWVHDYRRTQGRAN